VSIAGTSLLSGGHGPERIPLSLGSVTAVGTSFDNDTNITQTGAGNFQSATFGSVTVMGSVFGCRELLGLGTSPRARAVLLDGQ
jgi:hypothetical protein